MYIIRSVILEKMDLIENNKLTKFDKLTNIGPIHFHAYTPTVTKSRSNIS